MNCDHIFVYLIVFFPSSKEILVDENRFNEFFTMLLDNQYQIIANDQHNLLRFRLLDEGKCEFSQKLSFPLKSRVYNTTIVVLNIVESGSPYYLINFVIDLSEDSAKSFKHII
jgi:hypothetical protein